MKLNLAHISIILSFVISIAILDLAAQNPSLSNGVSDAGLLHENQIHLNKKAKKSEVFVGGKLFYDVNNNCILDKYDLRIPNSAVNFLSGKNDLELKTDFGGRFSILSELNLGEKIELSAAQNSYWQSNCGGSVIDTFVQNDDSFFVYFPLHASVNCPLLEVTISEPTLSKCMDAVFNVSYVNNGSIPAENAMIDVFFDELLTVSSASAAWDVPQIGNKFTFQLGDIQIGQEGSFNIYANVSCNSELGQTHCVEAYIYPDSSCFPTDTLWDGASLEVEGFCYNDTVEFRMKNVGSDMSNPTQIIVIEDNIMTQQPFISSVQLMAGESHVQYLIANGATYTFIASQPIGHPFTSVATDFVEGCGTDSSGFYTLGQVEESFEPADQSPFVSIYCGVNQSIGGSGNDDEVEMQHSVIRIEHRIMVNQGPQTCELRIDESLILIDSEVDKDAEINMDIKDLEMNLIQNVASFDNMFIEIPNELQPGKYLFTLKDKGDEICGGEIIVNH